MCLRCREKKAEQGRAVCDACRSDLEFLTACQREAANAQLIAERQAAAATATAKQTPKRKRTEWREAV